MEDSQSYFSKEDSSQPLGFEDFSVIEEGTGRPVSNNFYLYFTAPDRVSNIYRSQPYYKKFEVEHPDLSAKLCEGIQSIGPKLRGNDVGELLKPYMKDLYEAYTIMRKYGTTDHELFM